MILQYPLRTIDLAINATEIAPFRRAQINADRNAVRAAAHHRINVSKILKITRVKLR